MIRHGTTKRGYFFKVVLSEYEKLGTLDQSIKDFIMSELESRKGTKSGVALIDNLFTNSPGHAWKAGSIKGKAHVMHILEQYTKPPSAEEKD
jgi:hypothetical protein